MTNKMSKIKAQTKVSRGLWF